MRIWQIILLSVAAATIAGGAVAGRILSMLSQYTEEAIAAAIYPAAPLIAGVWLGTYALCALGLATVVLIRAFYHAGRIVEQRAAAIVADPAESETCLPPALQRLRTQLRYLVFAGGPEPQAALTLRLSGMPTLAQRACLRLYFGLLARTLYPAALALLLALAVVQFPAVLSAKYESVHGVMPAVPGILLLVALAALWGAGRLMMFVGIHPFVRALTLLPIESQETLLLRQLLQRAPVAFDILPPLAIDEDRLRAAVDAGQQPALREVARLTDAVNGLNHSTRSDLSGINAALTALSEAARLGENEALRSEYRQAAEELHTAVTALGEAVATMTDLSSSLESLTVVPRSAANGGEPVAVASLSLLRELQLLSREMDADLPGSRGT